MKMIGLRILALCLSVFFAGCVSVPSVIEDATSIPSGYYVPCPRQYWYAGRTIQVCGDSFIYDTFTDALPEEVNPPIKGKIRKEGDHFAFDVDGKPFQVWYLGSVAGKPVIISPAGLGPYNLKKKIDATEILYYKIPEPNKTLEPTAMTQTPSATISAPLAHL